MRSLSHSAHICSAIALALCLLAPAAQAKGPKIHSAAVGKAHPVFWTTAADPSTRLSLSIRPLIVDGRRKAWVFGDVHDVTDHTFVALEVQHINDALPGDKLPHYIWQTASWLLVERNTGHVSAVHFNGYDPALSGLSWFRDYAAFCSLNASGKILSAEVIQLGSRKPIAHKKVGNWPLHTAAPEPDATTAAPADAPAAGDGSAPVAPTESTTATPAQPDSSATPAAQPHAPAAKQPANHPHPAHITVTPALNTGAPKPAVCSSVQWERDPLRAVLTPRADLPPITLDLAIDLSPAAAPAE
jgi:hypothetical protein